MVSKEATAKELSGEICAAAPEYVLHHFIKKSQSTSQKNDILFCNELDSNSAVIQVDFAENYKCQFQDEPQAAHFGQEQVSLLTVAIWHRENFRSIVIATDDSIHDKRSVVPMLSLILELLPETASEIRFWSDNATSQFKNKFIVASLKMLMEKYSIKITWSYFAAQHGKGVVDGLGATVKKWVWSRVRTRKTVVTNASEFADACDGSKIQVIKTII